MKKFILCVILCSAFPCKNISAGNRLAGMRNLTPLEITADMGAGWNLGNSLDAHSGNETSWGNPLTTKEMIDVIKQKGFKTLRVPTTWYTHLGPAPDYLIDVTWLNRVEEVVNFGLDNDMYVILNIHHDESWLKPTYALEDTVTKQLVAIWTQVAERFIDYSDYLIFETMNEPRLTGSPEEWTGGTAEGRDVVNKLNVAALNAIRSTGGNNATRFIMAPPYAAAGWGTPMNAYVVPNNDSLVIVSIHNYSPYAFCLQDPGVSTWGSASDKSALDNDLNQVYSKFITKGRAVVLGEWGSLYKNNTEARTVHAEHFVKSAKAKKLAPVFWDNGGLTTSGAMGIFNRSALAWEFETIADAIINNIISDVPEVENLPGEFALRQNYPNPFNPSTTIQFSIPSESFVTLKVFNMLGQEVAAPVSEVRSAGTHRIRFDASRLTAGVYLYRIQAGNFSAAKKLVLVK